MSLISEHMRDIACELEIIVTRAGVVMPHRARVLIDELHDCIGDLEESDKRLPCRCHLNEVEETDG